MQGVKCIIELIKDECKVKSFRNGQYMNGRCNCRNGFIFKNGECKLKLNVKVVWL